MKLAEMDPYKLPDEEQENVVILAKASSNSKIHPYISVLIHLEAERLGISVDEVLKKLLKEAQNGKTGNV